MAGIGLLVGCNDGSTVWVSLRTPILVCMGLVVKMGSMIGISGVQMSDGGVILSKGSMGGSCVGMFVGVAVATTMGIGSWVGTMVDEAI